MECFVALLALGVLVSFILSILAWSRVRSAEAQLRQMLDDSPRRFERLEKMVRDLAARLAGAEAGGVPAAAPAPEPVARRVEMPRQEAAFRAVVPEAPPAEPAAVPPAPPFVSEAMAAVPEPIAPAPPPLEVPAAQPVAPEPVVERPAPPVAAVPPPTPPPRPFPPRAASVPKIRKGFDWERLVGVKLFSWVAGIALVLAAILALRWSVDQGWFGPGVRLALGVATGLGLLTVCELKVARRYKVTADAMDAAGIAILFASLYAGHILWHLYPAPAAFVALLVVTAVAVLLSLRRDSLFIALLGLLGGFATPALLSTGTDRPITLFGYLLLLNAGLVWVARKRGWPLLSALALGLTVLYQWGWVTRFLTDGKVPLAMAIFLVFPLLQLALSAFARSRAEDEGTHRKIATVAAALPLLFVLYLAASPALGARYGLFFGFLFLLSAGLATVAAWRGPRSLHPLAAGCAVVAFLVWVTRSYTTAAWPGFLGFVALFVVFYLAVPRLFARLGRPLDGSAAWAAYAAPLLFFVFPILVGREPATADPALLFGVLFALLAVAGAFALLAGNALLFLPAAVLALTAEIVWSVRHLTPERRGAALVLYVVFGLFALAVPALAKAMKRRLAPEEGVFLAPAAYLLLLFVALPADLAVPPSSLFASLAVLLLAGAGTALLLPRGALQGASVLGAALVLLAWGTVATQAPWPRVAVFASLALAGFAWTAALLARRRAAAWGEPPARGFAAAAVVALFAGQVSLIQASAGSASPSLTLLLAGHAALLVLLFVLAEQTGWEPLAPFSVMFAVGASMIWIVGERAEGWAGEFAFPAVLFLLYAAWPFVLGERARERKGPFLAAILAGLALFIPALYSFRQGSWADRVGLLPLGFAAVLALVLWRLVRLSPARLPGEVADRGRIVQMAGAILAFVTVAIPLQLDREWITLGWALLAAALAWLWRRIPHPGLLVWTGGLAATVFVRLAFNPAVLTYHPRSGTPVFNWYLYTYLVPALAFLVGAWLLRKGREDERRAGALAAALSVGAVALLFLLLNIEIADFYSTGTALTFGFLTGQASLAEDLTYTLGWAVFAVALLVVGIAARNRPTRIAAILLLSVAVLKGFLHDMAQLGGLYRAGSFLGLAICLAAVALLIQRFVLRGEEEG